MEGSRRIIGRMYLLPTHDGDVYLNIYFKRWSTASIPEHFITVSVGRTVISSLFLFQSGGECRS